MYFIIYKTTNLLTGKFYIGKHHTTNPNDGYIGSGKILRRAIIKYGVENFSREILEFCSSAEELSNREREIVTIDVVNDDNCYNIRIGGDGGFSGLNSSHSKAYMDLIRPVQTREKYSENGKLGGKLGGNKAFKEELGIFNPMNSDRRWKAGDTHSEDTKIRMSLSAKRTDRNGKLNPQYGTMWITNGTINRKLRISEHIPDGWIRGRFIKRIVG